ncbi:hypothetical protein [Streptomyces violascens]|uniref:hypothetical protein n=1 Tax=Streptomyces violascens TaxID=67381 RepID=UPI0036870989
MEAATPVRARTADPVDVMSKELDGIKPELTGRSAPDQMAATLRPQGNVEVGAGVTRPMSGVGQIPLTKVAALAVQALVLSACAMKEAAEPRRAVMPVHLLAVVHARARDEFLTMKRVARRCKRDEAELEACEPKAVALYEETGPPSTAMGFTTQLRDRSAAAVAALTGISSLDDSVAGFSRPRCESCGEFATKVGEASDTCGFPRLAVPPCVQADGVPRYRRPTPYGCERLSDHRRSCDRRPTVQ